MEILKDVLVLMVVVAAYLGIRQWLFPKLGARA